MHTFPLLGGKAAHELHNHRRMLWQRQEQDGCGQVKDWWRFPISGEISLRRATMTIKVFRFPLWWQYNCKKAGLDFGRFTSERKVIL